MLKSTITQKIVAGFLIANIKSSKYQSKKLRKEVKHFVDGKIKIHKKSQICISSQFHLLIKMNNFRIPFFVFLIISLVACEPQSSAESVLWDSSKEGSFILDTDREVFQGKVTRIIDGDTVEVLDGQTPKRIRLAHIDAPERKQAFSSRSRQTLSELCFGQKVYVEFYEKDIHGRYVCVIYDVEGKNINKEMVRLGMAWHFMRYFNDRSYAKLEKEARKNKVGLWRDSNPIAPCDFRR